MKAGPVAEEDRVYLSADECQGFKHVLAMIPRDGLSFREDRFLSNMDGALWYGRERGKFFSKAQIAWLDAIVARHQRYVVPGSDIRRLVEEARRDRDQ